MRQIFPLNPLLGITDMSLQPKQILDELNRLLSSLDGVTVLSSQGSSDVLRIDLTITSPQSRLLVVFCAEAANVLLNIWARHEPGSDEAKSDPDRAIQYEYLSSKYLDSSTDPVETFMRLGAHLTWRMYTIGQLAAAEEKSLSKFFRARSISA